MNYKKKIAFLIALTTVLTTFNSKITAKEANNIEVIYDDDQAVVKNKTYLYAGPNVEYDKLEKINKLEKVKIVCRSIDNWYLVNYKDEYGFANVNDLDVTEAFIPCDLIGDNTNEVEAICDVNIRKEADTESEKIGLLKEKAKLQFLKRLDNGWYEVLYNNDLAYISANYLNEVGSIDLPNNYYKMIWIKNDTELLDKDQNVIGEVPQYECGEVYLETNQLYLTKTDSGIGYIKKEDAEVLEGTFVIVDESSQTLKLYENDEVILESPVVTGRTSSPTNKGKHNILVKQLDRTLVGANNSYRSFVNYWMQFDNDAEGLHDATWRSQFGESVSRDSGSHGCVNMPLDKAAEAYNLLEVGDTVIVKK